MEVLLQCKENDGTVYAKRYMAQENAESLFYHEMAKQMTSFLMGNAPVLNGEVQVMASMPEEEKMKDRCLVMTANFSDSSFSYGRPRMNNLPVKREVVRYEKKYLRKVDADTNVHAFYDIVPNNMGPVTVDVGARFGQIGEKGLDYLEDGEVLKTPYPRWFYWFLYEGKIANGFSDMTEYLLDEEDEAEKLFGTKDEIFPEALTPAQELHEILSDNARQALMDFNVDFLSSKPPFNARQIKSSWTLFDQLTHAKTAAQANSIIEQMIGIMNPTFDKKKGITVKSFMVKEVSDPAEQASLIQTAIDDAEARIHAMEAVSGKVKTAKKTAVGAETASDAGLFGDVVIAQATPEEYDHVVNDILKTSQAKSMVKRVYKCTPSAQAKKYEAYRKTRQNQTEAELLHGSRTENFLSIITNGLNIRVKAANGRMFGNGSYFSHDFHKSLGYTSYNGSKWAHGNNKIGFMAVFKVAYGNPCLPNVCGNHFDQEWLTKNGYDCVHAKRGTSGLMMDEIIVYDDAASCIEYLIEFGSHDNTY